MNFNSKQLSIKIFMTIVILFSINTISYALVFANYGDDVFEDPNGENTYARTVSIKSYIVSGAGYFLAGNSNFLTLLNRVETTTDPVNADFVELSQWVTGAIDQMSKTKSTYSSLVAKVTNTPYKQTAIDRLTNFDYNDFKTKRRISGNSMDKLTELLMAGDVRGVFSSIYYDTASILDKLQVVKASIDDKQFPDISQLWRLNQQFSETMLFGQYAAEVFYEVSK